MTLTEDKKLDLVLDIFDNYECQSDCAYHLCNEDLCECEVITNFKYKADDCPKLKGRIFDLEWEKEQG